MRNYWTCSKFADWIRGTTKLKCGTGKEWREWEEAAKAKYPIRWWIAEEGLDKIQDVWCYIPERINNVRYYINNRFVTRTHSLTAHPRDIAPGDWRDVGNRFLPCLFNELVDFVEVEQAWSHCVWDDEARKKYSYPWWRRWYRQWRCPEAGIDHLKWAMTLTNKDFIQEGEKEEPTYQAKAAKEILELYTWWKEVYPLRPTFMMLAVGQPTVICVAKKGTIFWIWKIAVKKKQKFVILLWLKVMKLKRLIMTRMKQ